MTIVMPLQRKLRYNRKSKPNADFKKEHYEKTQSETKTESEKGGA